MKFRHFSILFSTLSLFLFSCAQEPLPDIDFPSIPTMESSFIEGSIIGLVTDESGRPLSDVQVIFSEESIVTDENGYFDFYKGQIDENGSYLKFNKAGYFFNSKFVFGEEGQTELVRIQMIPKEAPIIFDSNQGYNYDSADGVKISFSPNSIAYESGGDYNGPVTFYSSYIDPSDHRLSEIMPGDLRAVNNVNEFVALGSFGMIAVEMQGSNGEKLNLKANESANIEIPIPQSLQSTAPQNIPLWWFDEANGYWLEKGMAEKVGDYFQGTVEHFSFWNCDIPHSFTRLSGSVFQSDGQAVPNMSVEITWLENGTTRSTTTNSFGSFSGFVPDALVQLALYDCDANVIHSQTVGPFNEENYLLPEIILDTNNPSFPSKRVFGKFVDCDQNPIRNGYVSSRGQLFEEYTFSTLDSNGVFSIWIEDCESTATYILKGKDLDNQISSPHFIIEADGSNSIDLGTNQICLGLETVHHFNNVTNPNYSYSTNFKASVDGSALSLTAAISEPDSAFIQVRFTANLDPQSNIIQPGVYNSSYWSGGGVPDENSWVNFGTSTLNNASIQLIEVGNGPGDLVVGSIDGAVTVFQPGSIPITLPLNFSFALPREN